MSTSSVTTLSEIRTIAKQYSDLVNSNFITDSEWNGYINLSYFELYDLLIQKYGNDYYVATPYSFSTDGTSQQYALPSNFYKLLGIDLQVAQSQNAWINVPQFMFVERNQFGPPNMQAFYGYTNLRYRLSGNNIFFIPIPSSGQNLRIWYYPRLTELVNDSDTVDGISGWQEYIILDAAIKAMRKQELDFSAMLAQKQALIQRIEAAAENRDVGNPQTVGDSRRSESWWQPFGWGNGGF